MIDSSGQSRTGIDFYRPEAWDFRRIVEMETRIFQGLESGVVTLRDVEGAEAEGDESDE